jgi:hypothetical protein
MAMATQMVETDSWGDPHQVASCGLGTVGVLLGGVPMAENTHEDEDSF